MNSAVIQVGGLVSALGATGVKNELQQTPVMHHADVTDTAQYRATAERIDGELRIQILLVEVLPGDEVANVKGLQGRSDGGRGDGERASGADEKRFARRGGDDRASRATLRKLHKNPAWAVASNAMLAASVFYPFTPSPEVAALSMSGSSAAVAINEPMLKLTSIRVHSAAKAGASHQEALA